MDASASIRVPASFSTRCQALLDVRLGFDTEDLVLSIRPGAEPPPVSAHIIYNGTGRLVGRWEVVLPGEEPPSSRDLLTEATLPVEQRGTQRRYTELERFNIFLPPTGEVVLPGPDVSTIPTHMDGLHLLLLRIEATDDKEGDSSLEKAGAGQGLVHAGAVAGFPIPLLRYYVGGEFTASARGFRLLGPEEGALFEAGESPLFAWSAAPGAALYRLEIEGADGEELLAALLEPLSNAYRAPSWFAGRAGAEPFRWRVAALGLGGERLGETAWRTARFVEPAAPNP